jgi:hypothetical protein
MQALSILIAEYWAKGNWPAAADELMAKWPHLWLSSIHPIIETRRAKYILSINGKLQSDIMWEEYLTPLIESLIKANRDKDAEAVVMDSAKYSFFRDFQRWAAEFAIKCGRKDLHDTWLGLEIPQKPDKFEMDDLENFFDYYFLHYSSLNYGPTTCLVVLDAKEDDRKRLDEILNQGKLLEWNLHPAITVLPGDNRSLSHMTLNPDLQALLRQREDWPEGGTYWAIFGTNKKSIAYGPGLPSAEALYQAILQSNIRTPAESLRLFVKEHPGHFEAKECLLQELKRIAEHKTAEALGSNASGKAPINADQMLPDSDDSDIWWEYAVLFRQMLPYYLEKSLPTVQKYGLGDPLSLIMPNQNPCASEFFVYSQTMKNIARTFVPLIEAGLKRTPYNIFLWGVWASFSGFSDIIDLPGRLRELNNTMVRSPLAYYQSFPVPEVRKPMVDRCIAGSDWQGVIDLLETGWEDEKDSLEKSASLSLTNREATLKHYMEAFWEATLKHLLEAYLRLEKDPQANRVVRELSQSDAWEHIGQMTVDLAKKCGKDALAEQWRKM